jgi:hypothetical protein
MNLILGFFLDGQQRINAPRLDTQFAQASRDSFKRLVTMLHLHFGLLLLRHQTTQHRASYLRVVASDPFEIRREATRRIEIDLAPSLLQRLRLLAADGARTASGEGLPDRFPRELYRCP